MTFVKEQIGNYVLFLMIGVILGIILPMRLEQLAYFLIGCGASYFIITAVMENKQNARR
jgi:hypothetical protein